MHLQHLKEKVGALIETSPRRLKNEAEYETKRNTALRMLKTGKLTIEEIAECSDDTIHDSRTLYIQFRLSLIHLKTIGLYRKKEYGKILFLRGGVKCDSHSSL